MYKSMRNEIINNVKAELIGPDSEAKEVNVKNELITEDPLQRYTMGILYPQKMKTDPNIDTIEDSDGESGCIYEDDNNDLSLSTTNEFYPSSIGISFFTTGIKPSIDINVKTGIYNRIDNFRDCKVVIDNLNTEILNHELFNRYFEYNDNILSLKKRIDYDKRKLILEICDDKNFQHAIYKINNLLFYGWKRKQIDRIVTFENNNDDEKNYYKEINIDKRSGLKVCIYARPIFTDKITIFTVTLVNENEVGNSENQKKSEKSFFQVGFDVKMNKNYSEKFIEYKKNKLNKTEEELSLELLYRKKKNYGVGHGCSIMWERNDKGLINNIKTTIIPKYELPQLKFQIDELTCNAKKILEMKNLSTLSTFKREQIIEYLTEFNDIYKTWIDDQQTITKQLEDNYRVSAKKNIEKCRKVYNRIRDGIELIKNNDSVYKAFKFANKAMIMQRLHFKLKQNNDENNEEIKWPNYKKVEAKEASWRPFQLAFILLSLKGINDPNSDDREIVDLIWFPTGGGKTEAYLGVAAFTIFYRRMKNPIDGDGTAILMRYTLRLLTSQQFQRASTLILACEKIRQNNEGLLGKSEISIGMWIGGSSTPNNLEKAFRDLKKLQVNDKADNPFQVLNCPWCGTKMTKDNENGILGYRKENRPKRLELFCPKESCDFHKKLPIKVVDEDIYRNPPTLLFSTVDKFALLPWKKDVSSIFGLDINNRLSPELIIQDELHLISGPLGTIVGIYESVIDLLCSSKGINPKIIASTATIRRAQHQINSLYNRDMSQFPPSGINVEDSFFSREAKLENKPGRLYVGIMSSGRTSTTTLIRTYAAILQIVEELDYEDEVKDKFWTLVGYFNSIRELGKASTLSNDDIKDQIRRISKRHNHKSRMYFSPEELTSRRKSDEIPKILNKMEISYPNKNSIDILLASNMISVGVDVDRLSLMAINGQPKTTSEYIQASSRIGRKYPGIIYALYNGTKSRDRSHYEQFISYHQSLYKYVEPTSVTPFSIPSRDRALRAVLVSFIRHYSGFRKNNDLKKFDNMNEKFCEAIEFLLKRVENIQPNVKADMEEDINSIIQELKEIIEVNENVVFSSRKKTSLLHPAGKEGKYWKTLQSMRNVDGESEVKIIDYQDEVGKDV